MIPLLPVGNEELLASLVLLMANYRALSILPWLRYIHMINLEFHDCVLLIFFVVYYFGVMTSPV